jgi:hypothetical protein
MLAAATAAEFWRGRDEPLMSRGPIVTVLLAHAAMLLVRIPVIHFAPLVDNVELMRSVPFALLAFGTLLYAVVMAFLLLTMTKERTELAHKIASLVDPLCGVAKSARLPQRIEPAICAAKGRSRAAGDAAVRSRSIQGNQ